MSSLTATSPLDEIIEVDVRLPADGGTGGGPGQITLDVDVRDCNQGETLQWQVWLDYAADLGTGVRIRRGELPPSGSLSRELSISIDTSRFGAAGNCRKLELLVSGEFRFDPEREPQEPGDLSSSIWWVGTVNPDEAITLANVPLENCRQLQ